ncbi:MAG TPA: P44/Msp2 family outer membrane protein [Sphingomicrobium sp.]|nr:P44/Msp2 family outer membrane protein [Sphingomicrobium sp.]
MRKHLLAATAAAAIASPALAAADGPYVGVEGGVTFPNATNYDVTVSNGTTTTTYADGYHVRYKTGYDVDVLAGYKLGLFKLEAEGGYQRAKVKGFDVSNTLLTNMSTAAGAAVTPANLGIGNHIGVTKLMANALVDSDFGGGFGGYAGGGVGRAWARFSGAKDNAWAYQGIAGLRYAVTPNVDVGVKYEYFRTAKLNFNDAFAVNGTTFTTRARGNYASNNVLGSLVYNFNSRSAPSPIPAAAPAPPPPPPPAATQTCPDGSVILATSACPAPPPPPPPPPAQRGERG